MKTNHSPRGRKNAYACVACLLIIGTVVSIKNLGETSHDHPKSKLCMIINDALLNGSKLAMGVVEMYSERLPKGTPPPKGVVRGSWAADVPNELPRGFSRAGQDQSIGAESAKELEQMAMTVFTSASELNEQVSRPVPASK